MRAVHFVAFGLAMLLHAPAAAQTPERSTRFDAVRWTTTGLPWVSGTLRPSVPSLQDPGSERCRPAGPCVGNATLGALGGTALGALAGGGVVLGYAALAYGLGDNDDGGPWLLAIYGSMVGAGVGMPIGAHLANGRRGSLALDFLIPAAATYAASWFVLEHANQLGVIIPVTTLATVVATEVLTAR